MEMSQPIAYSLTMPTAENKPFFAMPEYASALVAVVQELRKSGLYKLYAFVVMPDRLELLLHPSGGHTLKQVLYELRLRGGQAMRNAGIKTNLWAPRSEIGKYFDPRLAAERILKIVALPVEASLASNPEAFRFSSAHADSGHDPLDDDDERDRPLRLDAVKTPVMAAV